MNAAVDAACQRFGESTWWSTGGPDRAGAFASAAETGSEVVEAQFSPKLRGLFYLINAMRGREPRRWVLHSSISTVLGGLGLAAYSGANAMFDAIGCEGGADWLSIDWDAWDNAAEAQSVSMPSAIKPPEGRKCFLRLFGASAGFSRDCRDEPADRLKAWVRHTKPRLRKRTVA